MRDISLLRIEEKIPIGNLRIDIQLIPRDLSYIIYPILIDIGKIKLGSDEDSDLIYFPGEVNIKIYFKEHIKDVIEAFQYIQERITNNWCSAYIYINNNLIWQGYVDRDSDKLKLSDDKIMELTILDQTIRIKDLDPKTNPFGYTDLNEKRKILDIIKDFFINQIFMDDNYINQIECYSTFEGRILINFTNYITILFNDFRADLNFYFSNNNIYNTLMELFKSILINYNLIAYIGFERKLYLLPRFVEFNQIYEIQNYELINEPDYKIIDKIEGLKVKVYKGSLPKQDSNYYIYYLGNYVENDPKCEELIIDQPAGSFPGGGFSGIAVYYQSQLYWIEFDNIRYKRIDGTYTNYQALYKFVADDVWNQIKYPRLKCDIEVNGIFYNWQPNKYYKLFNLDIIFRATKFEYDLMNNKTKISLRQVGIMPINYKLLEDGSYRLTENNTKRLLEYYLGGSLQLNNQFRLTEDFYYRLLEDGNKRLI